MWHREKSGLCYPEHEFCLDSLQVRIALSHTDRDTHAVSVVPESVAQKKTLPHEPRISPSGEPGAGPLRQVSGPFMERMWRNMWLPAGVALFGATPSVAGGIDLYASAGSVMLINNHSIHAGTVRQTPEARIDLRFDYGHRGFRDSTQRRSVPPRLLADPLLAELWDTTGAGESLESRYMAPAWVREPSALGGGHVISDERLGQHHRGRL